MKALGIQKIDDKPGAVYYPLQVLNIPTPTPTSSQVLVKLTAASLNHRDLFIRQALYPGISFSVPLLADGSGILNSKPVIIHPGKNWATDLRGPPPDSAPYCILGGNRHYPAGTLAEYICVEKEDVFETPGHLDAVQAAALPLCGMTAWRAVVTKAGVKEGDNVLITGIGGGVALMALQFCVALGAKAWVTSGSAEKLQRAKELGASGGVSYKNDDWTDQLRSQLPKERPWADAVIDGAGGDVVARSLKVVRNGAKIAVYGMTLGPKIEYSMQAVMRNVDVVGTTMSSRKEFGEMVQFVGEKKIVPVVSRVVDGLEVERVESLFKDMKEQRQFGKLVVRIGEGEGPKL